METKEKDNGLEMIGLVHFYSEISKEKRAKKGFLYP